MKAMVLTKICKIADNRNPLIMMEIPIPIPRKNEILIRVSACGVCHTELDEIEGRLQPYQLPIILGHQIVGRVEQIGDEVSKFKIGERVGIGWIYSSCQKCNFCANGKENLCAQFNATGKDANGGYAEYAVVSEDFAFNIHESFSDAEAAPLLCAGAIGYRSLSLCNLQDGQNLGLIGFGASAHLVIQIAGYLYPNSKVFVFARTEKERAFAKSLGAYWAGNIEDTPPEKMHSAIDTTPVWRPVIFALKNLHRSGRLVINAIRKEEVDKDTLLTLDYPSHLWLEKEIKTVANVTRKDIGEFLALAAFINIRAEVQEFRLEDANIALCELKEKKIKGAKVLILN